MPRDRGPDPLRVTFLVLMCLLGQFPYQTSASVLDLTRVPTAARHHED